jgi:hypothetical protein
MVSRKPSTPPTPLEPGVESKLPSVEAAAGEGVIRVEYLGGVSCATTVAQLM